MPCEQNNTCDCQCTLVFVDPDGSNIAINADRGGRGTNGCHCDLTGTDGVGTTVDMWVSDELMFIKVVTGGVEYHGTCEGTAVCDAEGNFDCGGTVVLHDVDLNTLVVTVDGRSCTSCLPSGYPEVICTIFDASYVGPGITWCGQLWSQEDINNGAQKIVCPSFYEKGPKQSYFGTTCFSGYQEQWKNGAGGTYGAHGDLNLMATWRGPFTLGIPYYQEYFNRIIAIPPGEYFQWFQFQARTTATSFGACLSTPIVQPPTGRFVSGYTTYGFLPPGFADAGPSTLFNGRIADDFFGRFSSGGIQYTWERGGGW